MVEQVPLPPPPPQWVLDLDSKPIRKSKPASIPDPPGYVAGGTGNTKRTKQTQQQQRTPPTAEETNQLKLKKAWELALAPAKQLPMNGIMMYMSGNSLQIFSIMMVFMLFKGPIQGLMNVNQVFSRFEAEGIQSQMLGIKLVYVLMQLLALGLGVWKVNGMGLLPTARSDWLAWETERLPLERAIPAFR
ncbi:hypothetical protein L228DRAFT_244380 [Xylona heveae TC161]|uniref:ER membrane protein complex subunit 4 n=1 Tax=Xylona heveae (strain CBS 132557 / TC161) TaxID=1328760 RepID=A0A161TH25_XYLHT|nr:hypothetical protein L228DRAFT_244380 [Xylona heveae TC161]KZF25527.1 hypothetical protein L228DRAFT_244380 [Xylona heveae TC161]